MQDVFCSRQGVVKIARIRVMLERIVLSNINDRQLLRSMANFSQNCFNIRFFNSVNLAKEALLRSGIVINEKSISTTKQECIIYGFLKDIDYFKDCNYEDARSILKAINYARKLCRGDELEKIEYVFSDGEFIDKNRAILSVYKRYKQYLKDNNYIDDIGIINKAINTAVAIDSEFIIFNEEILEPLEEKLLQVVSNNCFSKIYIRKFIGLDDKPLSNISYANGYGAVNEIEYILGYIASNKIAYEDCLICVLDDSYINQFLTYRDTYNVPMSFGAGVSLSSSKAYKLLTLLDRWNKAFNGFNGLYDLIYAPEFNGDKFWNNIGSDLKQKDKLNILKVVGSMRISINNDNKLDEYKNTLVDKKELDRFIYIEKFVNELYKGYAYLIKTYTNDDDNKAIDIICEYLNEYFDNVTDGILDDVINNLKDKKYNSQLSKGGSIHICDLNTTLACIRKHLFICGLNAKTFPGSPSEDYLLLDSDLARFNEECVRNSQNKIRFNKQLLNDVLDNASAYDCSIHLSYAGYNLSDLKLENPSSMLFEIYKRQNGEDSTIEQFENDMGEQHHYFEQAFTSLKNIGNKYLDGVNVMASETSEDKYGSVRLDRIISPSSADVFFECPKRFYLSSILGIYEPQDDDPFNSMPANDEGSLIHECMQDYGNNPSWSKDEFMANAKSKLQAYFKKRIPIHTNNMTNIETNYLDMALQGYDSDPHLKVDSSEKWLGPYTDSITGLSFGGIVDRVEQLENGNYQIVDYKTYKDIKNIDDDIDTCFQVVLYAYLLEKLEHKQVESCEYRYLRNPRVIKCQYNDNIKKQLEDKLMKIKSALDSGIFECADDEKSCRYCKYANICLKETQDE